MWQPFLQVDQQINAGQTILIALASVAGIFLFSSSLGRKLFFEPMREAAEAGIWILRRAGKRAGEFQPLTLKAIAAKRTATGGPISAAAALNAAAVVNVGAGGMAMLRRPCLSSAAEHVRRKRR